MPAAPSARHPGLRPPAAQSRRARRWAATLALPLVLAVPVAHAEQGDRDKPINYSADAGDVNYQTKVGSLSGNVIITQGTLTIHADKVVMKQNADNSMSVSAVGNPVTFRQKRDGSEEYYEGYAQRAEYDGAKEFLQLFDHALLRRGKDEIRSNYITYNAKTEVFKAEGRAASEAAPAEGNPGARVRGVFQPKSDAAPAKAAKGADTGAASPGADTAAPAAAPATTAPLQLKPAAELAPPAAK
jgi:lipopolysaccharide export system protein LptA